MHINVMQMNAADCVLHTPPNNPLESIGWSCDSVRLRVPVESSLVFKSGSGNATAGPGLKEEMLGWILSDGRVRALYSD